MLTHLLLGLTALASLVSAQTSSPNITLSSTAPIIIPNITLSSTGLNGNFSSSSTIPSFNSSSTGSIGNFSSTGVIGNTTSSTGVIGNTTSSTGVIGNTTSSTGFPIIGSSSSTGSQGGSMFCGGAGYNLSSLANMDITLDDGSYTWAIRPCGRVSPDLDLCDGMMCQDGTTISRYEPSIVNWYTIPNGVILDVQNGDAGGCSGPRSSEINFICNVTQLTPRLVSVSEPSTCNYRAIVHTAAACTRNSTYQPGVGDAFLSNICGGGAYDLSVINDLDFTAQFGTWNYTIRPCGLVSQPACSGVQPVSICQWRVGGNTWKLADYSHDVPLYEINPNGLNMSMESGTPCGNTNRSTLVTFDCDPAATRPVMVEQSEYMTCKYWFRVRTNAVCGAPFQLRSSSSGVPVVRSSSSTGLPVIGSSSASASSSTGLPVIGSSSSSSAAAGLQSSSSSTGPIIPPPIFDSSSSSSSGPFVPPPIFDSSSSSSSQIEFPIDSSSTGDVIEDPGVNGAAMASSLVAVIVSLMAVAMAL